VARTRDEIRAIFERTDGICHLCRRRLALRNYGLEGRRGAWEVDHSRAKARGGSDRINNLLPAHIQCNRSKRDSDNTTIRRRHGYVSRPRSRDQKEEIRARNAVLAGGALGVLGRAVGGPGAWLWFGLLGAIVGYNRTPIRGSAVLLDR